MRSAAAIFLILALGGGLIAYQCAYIREHLPLIEAGLTAADSEGEALLKEIGLPEGAKPHAEGLKTYPVESRRGMWRGTKCRVRWDRAWTLPGTHESVERWFHERLATLGWRPFTHGIPSSVEKSFFKDKWLLSLRRSADFSTDREPTVRHTVVLEWDYWHELDR